jgi:hypothetical protein
VNARIDLLASRQGGILLAMVTDFFLYQPLQEQIRRFVSGEGYG